MAQIYIMNEPNTDRMWLVDVDARTVELLDQDVIGSSGQAGIAFIETINRVGQNIVGSSGQRGECSDRALSFDKRSDASDRALSFDKRSNLSDRALSFDQRGGPSDRALSASPSSH
jgi:hypothetical protein